MTSVSVPLRRPVLADLIPGTLARDVALVIGVALLTAAAAQVQIPLGFTPVPISGQTFAILLGAAAVGPLRGSLAQLLYIAMGGVGLPFYSGGESGWQHLTGATGGYIVGFVAASAVVGALARRGLDRRPLGMALAFAAGTATIYLIGAAWLAQVAGLSAGEAIAKGVAPFLVGDAVKALLAAALLPAAWRLTKP
ncbi:MAG TPA: biotin transporter BioY [Egibacteraceae bacterium]|nr:biotin transporter BioY [Egibacteraceae bacterium]